MKLRKVAEVIQATAASDGDGVKLLRVFGGVQPERFDPFLLLDEFGSAEPDDYIGGFPPHPHRGFQTVTYMLQGKMEHRDHMGNIGLLEDGGVQWMTAGKGIIHSEMPKQTAGRMRGFQLWINLPAAQKMQPSGYQDIPKRDVPEYCIDGTKLKAIAGDAVINGQVTTGYFSSDLTQPVYLDVSLLPGKSLTMPIDPESTVLIYVYEGSLLNGLSIPSKSDGHNHAEFKVHEPNTKEIGAQQLARLVKGEGIMLKNASSNVAKFLLLAGKPLKEPIVQYGPFVMNSQAEIEQALSDYRAGQLA